MIRVVALALCLMACGDPKPGDSAVTAPTTTPPTAPTLGTVVEVCGNGLDDDENGLTDCDDPACFGNSCPEVCGDGLDNDADGAADCADVDCDEFCMELCDDGIDNDEDLAVDCDDEDCRDTCDADGDGAEAEAMPERPALRLSATSS